MVLVVGTGDAVETATAREAQTAATLCQAKGGSAALC